VAHPGEQVFRPEMTVRQAVALAGGPGWPRTSEGYRRDYSAVRSEIDIARLEQAKTVARIARLGAQLSGRAEMPALDLAEFKLPREQADLLLKQEAQVLTTTMADYQREGAFLKASVAQTADRITVVEKQKTQEEDGSRADSVELQRMIDLLSRGQEINPRVTEARRALLLSSTRALQVNVELLELKRQKAEAERNIQRLEDGRRVTWLKELQDATQARETAAIKVRALEAEIVNAGKPQRGDIASQAPSVGVEVVRRVAGQISRSNVDNDFELMPGDTIEVTIAINNQTAERAAVP
jgi:polysaccharide biosynthesis/export protein